MDEVERYRRLAARARLPFVETVATDDPTVVEAAAHVPAELARWLGFVPLQLERDVMRVACVDPRRRESITHALHGLEGVSISFSVTHPEELTRALESLYGERPARPRGELRRAAELRETKPPPLHDEVTAPAAVGPDENTDRTEGWLRRHYVQLRTRFILSVCVALLWVAFSVWFSLAWIHDLSRPLTTLGAVLLICGIAIVPGYLNVQIAMALLLDRPPRLPPYAAFPAITIVIAAYNEEEVILETLEYATAQDYPGPVDVVVADDGSTDSTPKIVTEFAKGTPRVRLVRLGHGGKAHALNAALATVESRLVATIDADTVLMPYALRRAVARLLASPPDTVAVAGAVFVRNSRATILARLQEWDYFLGIAAVKRQQALLQGTLVAQGSFSVYNTSALHRVNGWPNRIGEDIVLTWAMLRGGGRTTFEPTALAFTVVPQTLRHFARQRQRWARGMIEGLKDHGLSLLTMRRYFAHSIGTNYAFPYLDFVYTVGFIPGIALAFTGDFAIVGPMTLAVLPVSLAIAGVMLLRQRGAFRTVGAHPRRNILGFAGYILFYPFFVAPIAFTGYLLELAGSRRIW